MEGYDWYDTGCWARIRGDGSTSGRHVRGGRAAAFVPGAESVQASAKVRQPWECRESWQLTAPPRETGRGSSEDQGRAPPRAAADQNPRLDYCTDDDIFWSLRRRIRKHAHPPRCAIGKRSRARRRLTVSTTWTDSTPQTRHRPSRARAAIISTGPASARAFLCAISSSVPRHLTLPRSPPACRSDRLHRCSIHR